MSLASLKDQLSTGIESLDHEHRKLVGTMEELCASFDAARSPEEVRGLFGALHARAAAHFALEERLMREKKYPRYEAHKADHERLLDQVRAMMEAFEAGRCKDCGVQLRDCLEAWLAGHVRESDAGLRGLGK